MKSDEMKRYLSNDYEYIKERKVGKADVIDDAVLQIMIKNEWYEGKSPIQLIYETEYARANMAGDSAIDRCAAAQHAMRYYTNPLIDTNVLTKEDRERILLQIVDLNVNHLHLDPREGLVVMEGLKDAFASLQGIDSNQSIQNIKLAKREIGRLNKEGKSSKEIADEMVQRCDFDTMLGMCKEAKRLEEGKHTVWEYLLIFINTICLGKDVTGIKAQENAEKELLRRAQEPQGGGRGA